MQHQELSRWVFTLQIVDASFLHKYEEQVETTMYWMMFSWLSSRILEWMELLFLILRWEFSMLLRTIQNILAQPSPPPPPPGHPSMQCHHDHHDQTHLPKGGGKSERSRRKTRDRENEGEECPTLEASKSCNTFPCSKSSLSNFIVWVKNVTFFAFHKWH